MKPGIGAFELSLFVHALLGIRFASFSSSLEFLLGGRPTVACISRSALLRMFAVVFVSCPADNEPSAVLISMMN